MQMHNLNCLKYKNSWFQLSIYPLPVRNTSFPFFQRPKKCNPFGTLLDSNTNFLSRDITARAVPYLYFKI